MGWDQSSGSPVTPLDWDSVVRRSDSRSPVLHSVTSDMDSGSMVSTPSLSRAGSEEINWMTDEAISERASKWGNKVAETVVKNVNSRRLSMTSSFGSARTSCSSYSTTGPDLTSVPRPDGGLESALSSIRLAFMVCDARDSEARILYASSGFHKLTGYSAEEAVGRPCWFLLENGTDPEKVTEIQSSLQRGDAFCGTVVNYRKDGTPFWNLLSLSPINDDDGGVIKYFGMLTEVDGPLKKSREKRRRAKSLMEDIEAGRSRSILASLVEDVSMSPVRSTITDSSGPLSEEELSFGVDDCFPTFRDFSQKQMEEANLQRNDGGPSTEASDCSARITKARHQYSLSTGGVTGRPAAVLDREAGESQRHSKRYSLTISPQQSMEFRSRRSLAVGSDSKRSMGLSASGKWSLEYGSKPWRPSDARRYSMSVLEKDPAMQAYLAVMPPEVRGWYSSMAAGSVVLEMCDDEEAKDGDSISSQKSRPLIWHLAGERSAEFEEMGAPNPSEELRGLDNATAAIVSGEVHHDEKKVNGDRESQGLWRSFRWRIQRQSKLQMESAKPSKISSVPQIAATPFRKRSDSLTKFYRSDVRPRWNGWVKAAMNQARNQVASARQSMSYLLTPGADASRRFEPTVTYG